MFAQDLGHQGDSKTAAGRRNREGDAEVLSEGPRFGYPVLQNDVVKGRSGTRSRGGSLGGGAGGGGEDEQRGEDAGTACGLLVLAGTGGSRESGEAEVAAPAPVVLAVAYRAGCVDIAIVPAGIAPRCVGVGRCCVCCAGEVAPSFLALFLVYCV